MIAVLIEPGNKHARRHLRDLRRDGRDDMELVVDPLLAAGKLTITTAAAVHEAHLEERGS